MDFFRKCKLSSRLTMLSVLFSLGLAVYGAWSFKTLNQLKVNGPLYQRIVEGKDLIADVLPPPEYIIESYLVSMQLVDAEEPPKQAQLIARLALLQREYDERHAFWGKRELGAAITDILQKQAHAPALAFYASAFNDFIPAIRRHDKKAALAAMLTMNQAYEVHRRAIDRVVYLTGRRAASEGHHRLGQLAIVADTGRVDDGRHRGGRHDQPQYHAAAE